MPNIKKFHSKSFDINFNLLLLFLIAITFIGNYWMSVNDIATGNIYFFMTLGTIGIYVLAMIFIKGANLERISTYIRSPFSAKLSLAVLSFLVGWSLPVLTETLLTIMRKVFNVAWSITSFNIPLFSGAGGTRLAQSFSAVAFKESMQWKIFNISFNAGATEEFVFSFGLPLLGVLIAVFLLELIWNGKAPLGMKTDNFVIIFAILFASVLFMGAHQLNSTYVLSMFIIAFIFKVLSLVGIYFWGLFLTFMIGYHQSNNFIYLIQVDGWANVFNGLISWFGLGFVVFFMLLIWYVVRKWDSIVEDFSKYINS